MKCPWRVTRVIEEINSKVKEERTDFSYCYEDECPFYKLAHDINYKEYYYCARENPGEHVEVYWNRNEDGDKE